jgi:hypothetical protein
MGDLQNPGEKPGVGEKCVSQYSTSCAQQKNKPRIAFNDSKDFNALLYNIAERVGGGGGGAPLFGGGCGCGDAGSYLFLPDAAPCNDSSKQVVPIHFQRWGVTLLLDTAYTQSLRIS